VTLVEMLERQARDIPDKAAIFYQDMEITYGALNNQVNCLAHALMSLGLQQGDRLGFMLPRVPELVVTFLATAKARGIAAPISFELRPQEITTLLTNLSPRFMVIDAAFADLARKSLPPNANIIVIVVGETQDRGAYRWADLLKNGNTDNPSFEVKGDDPVYLNFTSGSTGNPKGAITTHANIFWNTLASVETLGLTAADVHLCLFAPFAHPHEFFARSLYLGGPCVLLETIRPKSIIRTIQDHKVTSFMAIAPIFQTLMEIARTKPQDLSCLRIPESGGMHTRLELIEQFRETFGVPIVPVWGSTETTGIAIANNPQKVVQGSVGKPCKSYEVKVVAADGTELPPNQIGELIFKGPGVVQEYFLKDGNNQKAFRNGWYFSGDLGKQDEEGNFYFIERKSGMLKVAGLQVYPLEVELALLGHPAVREAAVIGIEDNLRGEVPKAFVVLKNEQKFTERELLQYCAETMARYKVPKVIEFRAELPKSGSGKINKKALN